MGVQSARALLLVASQHCLATRVLLLSHIPTTISFGYVTFDVLAYTAAMIRDGKQHAWLSLPVDTLPAWAALNSVSFHGIKIGPLPGKEEHGCTVIAKRHLKGGEEPPLMTIPRELILSLERVHEHAKSDSDFRSVLDSLDGFGRVGAPSFHFTFPSLLFPRPLYTGTPESSGCCFAITSLSSTSQMLKLQQLCPV